MNGRAKHAQVYPPAVCRAICEGIHDQRKWDENGEYFIGIVESGSDVHQESENAKQASRMAHGQEDG